MKVWMAQIKMFIVSEEAASGTEYAIMIALIALTAIGAIIGMGTRVDGACVTLSSQLPTGVTN